MMKWDLTARIDGDEFTTRGLSYAQVNTLIETFDAAGITAIAKRYGAGSDEVLGRVEVNTGDGDP